MFDLKTLFGFVQEKRLPMEKPFTQYSPEEMQELGRCFLSSMVLNDIQQATHAIEVLHAATQKNGSVPF